MIVCVFVKPCQVPDVNRGNNIAAISKDRY